MRVLVATDAWHPQVNGVVRTLTSLARSARELGVDVAFLSPEGFRSIPVPTYPSLRLAFPTGRTIAAMILSDAIFANILNINCAGYVPPLQTR